MQTRIHLPFFLILFTIFSVSFSVSSATAQTLPVVGGAYQGQPGLPVVGGAYQGQPKMNCNSYFPPPSDQSNEQKKVYQACERKRRNAGMPEVWKKIKPFVDKARSFYSSQNITFENYRPIDGACTGPGGIWTIVNRNGVSLNSEGKPGRTGMACGCDVCGPGGEFYKEDGIVSVPRPNNFKYVYLGNSGAPGAGVYNFSAGTYTNNSGTVHLISGDKESEVREVGKGLIPISIYEPKSSDQPIPPSDDPVEAATQARDLAQQKVTTSKTELDAAKIKEQQAEQKLATAKTKLEEAIAALQKAEQDAAALIAQQKIEEEKRLAALKKAREEAEAKRLAFEKEQREEAERIAKAIRDAEKARLTALAEAKRIADEAAQKAAEEAAKIAAAEAEKQAEELKLAENNATDAKSVRQAAEDALKEALEAAKSGDSTAKLAAEEAQQKADAAKLEFNKKAEAAQKEAKEKARLAAEAAAKQEAEVAAAVAAMQKIEAAQKAAQDLARQAQEHAAKIREAWGLPTTSPKSGVATPGLVKPIQEETVVSPGEASISPAVVRPDEAAAKRAAEEAAQKAAAEQAATESQ